MHIKNRFVNYCFLTIFIMSVQITQFFYIDYGKQFISYNLDFMSFEYIINIIDVFAIWYLLHKLIITVKGTRVVQLIKGVATFVLIKILSEIVGLHVLSWLMNLVIMCIAKAAVVIFQPEIRRGLEHLGRSKFLKPTTSVRDDSKIILAFDKAIQYMSKRKIGALMTVERHIGLDEYVETGIDINADISGELLINIFVPNTPLHDGAVIVKRGKIAVASAYLPLSESNFIPKQFGTRHRAAVGISEVSDAVTIVVSEETGDISITLNNDLISNLTREKYLEILQTELFLSKEKEIENESFATYK